MIAVRNSSDRSSLLPVQNNKAESSPAPPAGFDHTTSIGRRRESLPPRPTSGSASVKPSQANPWHSKAPTHGPEEPIGNRPKGPSSNESSAPAQPRDEGLSAAFSNAKLRNSRGPPVACLMEGRNLTP